jgi:hypothetical protein
MHARPDVRLLPCLHATPAGRPAAALQFLGKMLPCYAREQHIDDPVEDGSIWNERATSFRFSGGGGNQGREHSPEVVIDEFRAHSLT